MADVRLFEKSEEHPAPNRRTIIETANKTGAWQISGIENAAIIESSQDMSYLEYDEDLVEDARDKLATETVWANNGENDADSNEE